MIAVALTSRYFWGLIGKPINFKRGEWILSYVYTLIERGERGEPSLHQNNVGKLR